MTMKRYFVTCEVGDCICELISRKLSDDEFEHLTYQDIADRLNKLVEENEVCKEAYNKIISDVIHLKEENEQLKNDVARSRRNFREMEEVKCELAEENEQLKKVLGTILLEVKQDISNTNQTGEIKVFINPNSFKLISEVLRKYGALNGWYE